MGKKEPSINTNKYKYTDGLRNIFKGNLVILASEESREWIKISRECFNILNKTIEMNLTHSEILDCFEAEDDKIYFEELIEKLYKSKILKDKNDKSIRNIEEVYLIVTDRCNLSCTHCCASAVDSSSVDELDTNDMFDVIDKIVQINPKNITISGGEPLIRQDIWLIMDYLKSKYNGDIDILTNGLLIDESNIKNIKKYFNSISISIDGVDEESCKIIRGNNVFKNVIKKIKFLKDNDLKHIRFHDLRHTHVTLLINSKVPIRVISERVGHSNINTTLNIYSHVLKEMDKEASDKISEVLFNLG